MDEKIRELEREAANGGSEAKKRLLAEKRRQFNREDVELELRSKDITKERGRECIEIFPDLSYLGVNWGEHQEEWGEVDVFDSRRMPWKSRHPTPQEVISLLIAEKEGQLKMREPPQYFSRAEFNAAYKVMQPINNGFTAHAIQRERDKLYVYENVYMSRKEWVGVSAMCPGPGYHRPRRARLFDYPRKFDIRPVFWDFAEENINRKSTPMKLIDLGKECPDLFEYLTTRTVEEFPEELHEYTIRLPIKRLLLPITYSNTGLDMNQIQGTITPVQPRFANG